jgi:hypothetical protein
MFIVENFDKRINLIEIGRKIRINFMYANLFLIRSRLQKSQRLLEKLGTTLIDESVKMNNLANQHWFWHIQRKYLGYRIERAKKSISHLIFFSNLTLQVVRGEYKIQKIFHKDILNYELSEKDLHVGDVILSYKTQQYLNNAHLSRLISIAQQSNITHSSVISQVE